MTTRHEIETNGSPNELKDLLRVLKESENQPGARWVLVVDDEPSVRRMVSRSMKSLDSGLNVHQAENGLEALKVLAEIKEQEGTEPVLIVTDLQMPILDGWEFIDKLWEKFQNERRAFGIPLIVLSSSSGQKGLFFGKSVHGDKCKYRPLISIAKEDCIKPRQYDSKGEKGLVAWIEYFLRSPA